MAGTVRVRGLKELQRDFKRMSKDLDKDLVKELKAVADPVKRDAKQLALSRIRNMSSSPRWAGMKIGVTAARDLVYMVPSSRGKGGPSRPNLASLLYERSMDPALKQNEDEIVERVDDYLGKLGDDNGF